MDFSIQHEFTYWHLNCFYPWFWCYFKLLLVSHSRWASRPVESIFSDNWDPKFPTVVPRLPHIHQSLSISNYKPIYIFFLTQWRIQVKYYFPSCTNLITVISFLFSFSSQQLLVKYILLWKLQVWIEQNSIGKFQIWGNLKKHETSST